MAAGPATTDSCNCVVFSMRENPIACLFFVKFLAFLFYGLLPINSQGDETFALDYLSSHKISKIGTHVAHLPVTNYRRTKNLPKSETSVLSRQSPKIIKSSVNAFVINNKIERNIR